ncbi:hypothetical protein TNCV_2242001 [Trichonephila clavipes]|nr:hypothetical protein TNCV_2242001 [Trichonephila clavipes]
MLEQFVVSRIVDIDILMQIWKNRAKQINFVLEWENKVPESVYTKRSSAEFGTLNNSIRFLVQQVTRFRVFKKIEPKFNLLCYPITTDIDTAPEVLQLDQSDLKSDYVKKMFIAMALTLKIFVS